MHLSKSGHPLTLLFVLLALLVAVLSLIVSHFMVKELSKEERSKMEIWALATESMMSERLDAELVLKILQSNKTIPVILVDKSTERLESHNIKHPTENIDLFLQRKIDLFERKHEPIILSEMNQILYYDDSYTLKQLQTYPYLQLIVISFFIVLAFIALKRSQRAKQNSVWIGLSKETAHQLGTPISSLLAWSEYLKLKDIDPVITTELDKDIDRLQMIVDRFSKIGSEPVLKEVVLQDVVRDSITYMEKRVSDRVKFNFHFPEQPQYVMISETLIGWVIENLIKNGVDAIKGEGEISCSISYDSKHVFLDITDNGKGISKSKFKSVFLPGYTTNERGWGLGLSLAKRIAEKNHKGAVFVKQSELGKGTTFRIQLKKMS
jgi:nitrogen-specific signal transduction histidine kinase